MARLVFLCLTVATLSTATHLDSFGLPLSEDLYSPRDNHHWRHPPGLSFQHLPPSSRCPGYTPPPKIHRTCSEFTFNLTCTAGETQEGTSYGLRSIVDRINTDDSTWDCFTLPSSSSAIPFPRQPSEENNPTFNATIKIPSVDVKCAVNNWFVYWLNQTTCNITGQPEGIFGTELKTCLY